MPVEHNPEYIHHTNSTKASTIRELVFGMEDGMVSTLGAITGVAAATQDPFTTILVGLVVVSVESISMGVGSYLSSKSVRAVDERKLFEEKQELEKYPEEEKQELIEMYEEDGWSKDLSKKMAEEASQKPDLFLQEMAYHELKIFPSELEEPLKNGSVMGISYIFGGAIPLVAYFIFPIYTAIALSIAITLVGLFLLGVYTAKFSKRNWIKAGMEMVTLAGLAAVVGYAVGQVVDNLWLK